MSFKMQSLPEHEAGLRRRGSLIWRTLPLAVDADTGMIVAQILIDQPADNSSQLGPFLAQVRRYIV